MFATFCPVSLPEVGPKIFVFEESALVPLRLLDVFGMIFPKGFEDICEDIFAKGEGSLLLVTAWSRPKRHYIITISTTQHCFFAIAAIVGIGQRLDPLVGAR